MINVKDAPYSASGNGTTDDSAAVKNAIAAAIAQGGAEVYFPAGIYNLPSWALTTPTPVPTLTEPVRLRGEVPGDTVLRGPGTTTRFAIARSELDVAGLTFENWGTIFEGINAPPVQAVSFENCTFRDSATFLLWSGTAAEFIGRLTIDRCIFRNLSTAVVSASMKFDAVYFTRSRVENCRRYVLRMSGNDEDEGRELVVFSDNYVANLTAEGFSGAAAVARVVQVICQRLVVTNNHVRRVRSIPGGGNTNFIYQSSVHAYVAGNHLEDIGTPGDATGAIIQEKNPAAISSRYIGNLFIQNPPAEGEAPAQPPAIQILGQGHTVVHGNEARGLRHALAFFFQNGGDLIVSNNVITDMDTPYGAIIVYGGENVLIESNVINGVRHTDESAWPYYTRAIRLERYGEPVTVGGTTTYVYHAPTDVRISNNVIKHVRKSGVQEGSAISVYLNGVEAKGLSIVGNTIVDCDLGVDLRVAGTGSFLDTEISYNTFRDNRVNVYAPTPPVAFTTRDNRGWATDATGTATVAAGATSVVVTHGLARTPAAAGITVTPASAPDLMGAGRFWISAVTATTFTISVDVAPGAPVVYAWTAQAG
ncbi:right-handed parallel beta-helix repeat-containing protein [Longimicrobium terrae]|uniref:Protein involved in ribonucleotide reduction n=1 Tax=Longimicrobium terrae TaxID=1639882 RepID=A0A841H1Y1_9BACT|nr:right-handed parallel beta-helix repeat-containing protein [Longimicrobium terrae]MBB4637595.1 protein involved in ribonucleotide reduction [Longimicrobium terrae]MBB6071992.1 protein involved in ribonucleotide reduction [Longimicrobium terrae]NNC29920.1 hypothetical protein [Longimicrobium terrae]